MGGGFPADEMFRRRDEPSIRYIKERGNAVHTIHVIHRDGRVDLPFVRLEKGDTLPLQAVDGTTRNRRQVNHLRLIRRRLVPSGNCLGRIGSVDLERPDRRVDEDRMMRCVVGSELPDGLDPQRATTRPSEWFAVREVGRGYANVVCLDGNVEAIAIDETAESNAGRPLGRQAELAAEAGNVGSADPRVGADRQPAPVTDLMMTEVRPLPEWIFAIVKPPSKGGDAPDEGATAAGYGDTGELAAMSAPFCDVG